MRSEDIEVVNEMVIEDNLIKDVTEEDLFLESFHSISSFFPPLFIHFLIQVSHLKLEIHLLTASLTSS